MLKNNSDTVSVLLVDDSRLAREKLKQDLTASGAFDILEADSQASANTILTESSPELILVDLQLPDGNGADLIRSWRKQPRFSSIPMIVVTGTEKPAEIKHCFDAGADDFLVKPWDPTALITRIRAHLRRRTAEERLNRLQSIFNVTEEIAKIGGWELDLTTNELTWTDELYRIVELPKTSRPTLESTFELYPESERDRVRSAVETSIRSGSPFDFESPFNTATGRRIYVHAMGRPEFVDGKAVRLWGTFQDITVRKQAEEERDRLFDLSIDMLCVGTFEGSFRQVNPAWTRCLGWTEEELLSRPWLEFVHPEDHNATASVMSQLLDGKPVVGFENRYLAKDGSIHWISWNTFPKVDEGLVFAVARDVTEHKAYQDRLAYDASHDLLSDLYNRGYLLDELSHQVAFAQRYDRPLSFALCDLDHFKRVNDTYGHQTGDQVIARFAQLLKAALREADLAGRYGGEEFAIIFPHTDAAGARLCLERALGKLRDEKFIATDGTSFSVTATFGVAQFVHNMQNMDALIAAADKALYSGKAEGRNRVVVATPSAG